MAVEIHKWRIAANSASGLIENVLNVLVIVWLHQYLVKRISAEEYSLYPVLTSVLLFIPLLTVVLTSGIGRYIVEANAQGDHDKITQVVSTMFPVLLSVALLLIGMGAVLALSIDHVLTIAPDRVWDAQIMMSLLVFSVSARLALSPFGVGLYVMQKFVLLNALAFCSALIRSALLFLLLIGVSPRVMWVVVATVTADFAVMLTTVVISRRLLPSLQFRWTRIQLKLLKPLTTFGFWNMVSLVAYILARSMDLLILNKLGTAQNVTAFHLGRLPGSHIEAAISKATAPLQPPMIALYAAGNRKSLQNLYLRGSRYALWAALFLSTPLIVLRHEFWSLYLGKSYEVYADAATVMALLLAVYWVTYPHDMIEKIAHATNQVKPLAIRWFLGALFNAGLTLYLVGVLKMGAVGSAAATLVVALTWEPVIMWKFSLKLVGLSFAEWFKQTVRPGILPALVATIFSLVLKSIVRPDGWTDLAIVVGCGCVVYISVLWAFCLKADERSDVIQIIAKARSLALSSAGSARAT